MQANLKSQDLDERNLLKCQILREAADRGYEKLKTQPMGTEDAALLLTNLQQIEALLCCLEEPASPSALERPQQSESGACEVAANEGDTENRETPAEETPDAETLERMKAELKNELLPLQNTHGVPVGNIINEMGYAKLSEVPWTRYQELRDLARAAAGIQ